MKQTIQILPFLLLITLCGAKLAFSQDAPPPKTVAELKAQLAAQMQKQHVAGMLLTLASKDSVLFRGGIGYADLAKRTSVTEQHLFRQASITKLFTALAILTLVKAGKLTVNAHLKDIAPEIPFQNDWEKTNPITIGQLLEHSTAFADKSPFEEYNFSGETLSSLASVNVFKKYLVSRWKPGEKQSYSGVNYAILCYIIERLSGRSFNQYLIENVFQPLGMLGANVHLSADGPGIYSQGYVWQSDHYQYVPHQPQYNPGYGSLNANAVDFAHALLAYLHDWQTPNGQFLSKPILDDSEIPHTYQSARAGFKNTYAYGNECHELDGRLFRGHRGAIGGYLSAFLYNRDLGVGYAFSLNTHNEAFYEYADKLIRQFLLQHLASPKRPNVYSLSPQVGKPYQGYYRLSNPGQLYSGFLDQIQYTFRLETDTSGLQVTPLLGGSIHWQRADPVRLWFRQASARYAHVLLLNDGGPMHAITDQTRYFTPLSALEAWAALISLLGSMLVLSSSLPFALVSLLLFPSRKWSVRHLLVRIGPALATLGLLVVLVGASHVIDLMRTCSPTDIAYRQWTLGKYDFAVCSISSLLLLVSIWKQLPSMGLKAYLGLLTLASCYLLGLFLSNGWFW